MRRSQNAMKHPEGKIFDLKPELTLAMKLAATFAITYYGLLLAFEIVAVVFRRYYFDAVYMNQEELSLNSRDFLIQLAQLGLSALLVFSLIQIFRKKVNGKLIFVLATLVLIVFQFIATGPFPPLKYIIEIVMLLFITPLRMKKRVRIKEGKVIIEEVKEEPKPESQPKETEPIEAENA